MFIVHLYKTDIWTIYRDINHWIDPTVWVDWLMSKNYIWTIRASVARVLVLTVWFPREIMSGK